MSRAKLARLMTPRLFSRWRIQMDIALGKFLLYILQPLYSELCQIQGSLMNNTSKMNEHCEVEPGKRLLGKAAQEKN